MKMRNCMSVRKRSIARSIPRKAWPRSSGGTRQSIASPAGHAAPGNARSLSLIVISAYCSALEMWRIVASLDIATMILSCSDNAMGNRTSHLWSSVSAGHRKVMEAIRDLPHRARKSITIDRGIKFVNWPHLQAGIGTRTWFCDLSSP